MAKGKSFRVSIFKREFNAQKLPINKLIKDVLP